MNSMIRSLGIWLIIGLVMLVLFNMMGSRSGNEQRISFTEFMDKLEPVRDFRLFFAWIIKTVELSGKKRGMVWGASLWSAIRLFC